MAGNIREIEGIDRTTARELEKEGIITPEDLANATLSDIVNVGTIDASNAPTIKNEAVRYARAEKVRGATPAEIEEDIRSTGISEFTGGAITYSDDSMTESPFTVEASGLGARSVSKIHENRPEREQTVDEKQNAPITTDEEKWVENKNRYDYPGVDTIPETRQAARAEQAAQIATGIGAADRVEQKGSAKNLQGKFTTKGSKTYGRGENVVRVQGTANQPERTLAHELGHAFDFGYGEDRGYNLTNELFDLDSPTSQGETEQLTDEAIGLSEKARGDFKGQQQYRRQYKELTADFVGQAIIQPRATKRDAPQLFERLQDAADQDGFAEAIPDPLGTDPERQGILND